ncbi:MAG: aminoglycoside phosphotransferase family protein [Anaerolineales bacterium]|nr:MAG: aminoglycoside phosphotransferase family protein [Anaerolineales bacterium]
MPIESVTKMHENEIYTDENLVRRLLAGQFPKWKDLSIRRVSSSGTDNALYRLGNEMVVRLPRIDWAIDQVKKEHEWMPKLAPHLPLEIPVPLEMGEPAEDYPWNWSVYRWLEGENRTVDNLPNPTQTAVDLAEFLLALQSVDITNGPLAKDYGLRGDSLSSRDEATREAIDSLRELIDVKVVTEIWENALQSPEWNRKPVWFHGDVLPGNLLFKKEKLNAVIDFGGLGVGDPACDLMIAWNLFTDESRKAFRLALGVDDATWARGRGHALSQALIFIPYYMNTHPVGVQNAWRVIHEVISEFSI